MITVKLPDGSSAQFPDGTPSDTMRAAIQKRFPPQQQAGMPAGYNPANVTQLQGGPGTQESRAPRPDLMGSTAATVSGFVNGIPVLGPMLQNTSDALVGVGSQLTGGDYGDTVEGLRQRRAELAAANPIADVAGNVAGTVATLGVGGTTKIGAEALGLAGKFGTRLLNSTLSSAGISGADALSRGQDALPAMAAGAAFGFGTPLVSKAVGETVKAVGRKVAPLIGSMKNPVGEAARRVGMAYGRDAQANPGMLMNGADEATAKTAGMPLVNVDRGGETTRALARSVANQSPEARAAIENTASDRFAGQGARASDFVRRLAGGAVDDLALQKGIRDTARMVNAPAYKAAYASPKAQQLFPRAAQELLNAPAVQTALRAVVPRSANRAAVEGFAPLKNVPFRMGGDGMFKLIRLKDGTIPDAPSLQFWDQVKRNLDGQIDAALSGARPDRTLAADIKAIKTKLVSALDAAVPQYKTAREGAAAFFGAEDALEAGKKFATTPKLVPEAKVAFGKFSAPEQKAFQVGYASELIDRIKTVGDRSNVINQVFKKPASREMIELVFGKAKASELEAYVRVEDIVDKLRGAMGGSTTVRQLQELGIGAGIGGAGGFAISGGNWGTALQGMGLGAGVKGAQLLGQRIDGKVMQEVAKLLLSNDPAALKKAVFQAQMSEQWMRALEAWGQRLEVLARGTGMAMAS